MTPTVKTYNDKLITMDAIKKKMQSLKSETENALARATQLDQEAKDSTQRAEKTEEHVRIFFQIKSFFGSKL